MRWFLVEVTLLVNLLDAIDLLTSTVMSSSVDDHIIFFSDEETSTILEMLIDDPTKDCFLSRISRALPS